MEILFDGFEEGLAIFGIAVELAVAGDADVPVAEDLHPGEEAAEEMGR